jgi:hypothetical protein
MTYKSFMSLVPCSYPIIRTHQWLHFYRPIPKLFYQISRGMLLFEPQIAALKCRRELNESTPTKSQWISYCRRLCCQHPLMFGRDCIFSDSAMTVMHKMCVCVYHNCWQPMFSLDIAWLCQWDQITIPGYSRTPDSMSVNDNWMCYPYQ